MQIECRLTSNLILFHLTRRPPSARAGPPRRPHTITLHHPPADPTRSGFSQSELGHYEIHCALAYRSVGSVRCEQSDGGAATWSHRRSVSLRAPAIDKAAESVLRPGSLHTCTRLVTYITGRGSAERCRC